MKRIIATIATLFTLAFTFSAVAKAPANPVKDYSSKKIALAYVDAITLGNTAINKYLFTKDFTYTTASNEQVYSRSQYLKFLKENQGLQYNCATNYEIMDETSACSVAKATMKFKNFTRVDYISMLKTTDGWKVSKVVTTYE